MKRRNFLQAAALTSVIPICGLPSIEPLPFGKTPALSAEEQEAIAGALGKKGTYNEAQATYAVPLPRNDLKVTVKGEAVPIPFGFGGWVAFKKTLDGKQTVMMSDTVLLEDEVNPLIDATHAAGLEVGAIHNHFFYEQPRIFYMHLHGMGNTADLAKKYAQAIRNTKLFPANQPAAPAPVAETAVNVPASTSKELFDLPALDELVKYKGVVNGPTYKYTIGRDDLQIVAMGAEMTAAIGLNSWASFAGKQDAAHIAGDIAMLEGEVNNVVKALRANNLEVVALHHHMLGEQPRTVFLHYYGRGPASTLAKGFRAALDQLGKAGPMKH
ncbi:DUF1259 domain-containing protein [Spirosoma pollinicola]|uniref:DUF1259 domain-containing protein n=1 Tax=Spirosoma pollinicola TaxID=2057025 RepID=A0A2K8Z3C8_9BACT|nr:DUF1259 domain-containing protein [Spirosoma pollinicola]AUD04383.1 hypothetical protein CWM47_22585 [Spirosoma pollinicola]